MDRQYKKVEKKEEEEKEEEETTTPKYPSSKLSHLGLSLILILPYY